MENKKIVIAIIIVIVLIVALVGISFAFGGKNTEQLNLLTEESNKLLQADLTTDNIDFNIKTEKNYATVEKAIKEYLSSLKNIYVEMEELVEGVNPNSIFSAQNMEDKNLEKVDQIIEEYKEKGKNAIAEYEELITEEKIKENIEKKNFSSRKEYYINLYNTVMLGDVMKDKYNVLEEKIKSKKDELSDKVNVLEKIKKFFEENDNYWIIKNHQIQITNGNKITEYYNLVNQLVD